MFNIDKIEKIQRRAAPFVSNKFRRKDSVTVTPLNTSVKPENSQPILTLYFLSDKKLVDHNNTFPRIPIIFNFLINYTCDTLSKAFLRLKSV